MPWEGRQCKSGQRKRNTALRMKDEKGNRREMFNGRDGRILKCFSNYARKNEKYKFYERLLNYLNFFILFFCAFILLPHKILNILFPFFIQFEIRSGI